MFNQEIFAERLLILRKKSGINQTELGKAVGISNFMVGKIELGKRGASIEVICALADFFNVSVDYLVGRTDNTDKPKTENPCLLHGNKDFSVSEIMCLRYLDSLNNEGQKKMLERAQELTEIPKYQKKETQKAE